MKLIARQPEGCSPNAFINWDKAVYYFKFGFYLCLFGRTIYLGARLRWMKNDRPIKILLNCYSHSAKANRLSDEFIQDVFRVYLTREMITELKLTNDEFERIRLSPTVGIKGNSMAARKKTARKRTTKKTLTAKSLGTGGAFMAGSAISQNKQRKCSAMGGKWVNGRCKY